MTERRRRPHAALASRIVTSALGAGATLAIVAALAANEPHPARVVTAAAAPPTAPTGARPAAPAPSGSSPTPVTAPPKPIPPPTASTPPPTKTKAG